MSVPTIIYWNPRYWELRESAIPYFTELKRVGIFHETAESAARHVAAIWHDVDSWWATPAVQEVLESFRNRYCYRAPSKVARVANALREVKAFPERPFETN
jgi:putative transferase (TIGR04331 family)